MIQYSIVQYSIVQTQTYITNCVDRFVDTTLLITNRFAQLAQKMGAR